MEVLNLPLVVSLFAVVGSCLGSFANMLIHRLPQEEEIIRTPSHCPKCNAQLKVPQLIPLFSYLWQRGKCHACRKQINPRYFWVELICASLFALIGGIYGATFLAAVLCLVALCLVILTAIDLEHMIIPDEIQVALGGLGLLHVWATGKPWLIAIVLAAVGFAFGLFLRWLMVVWKKREGLGWGDIKFLAVAGLYLDWSLLAPFCFFSGMMGIFTAGLASRTEEGHFAFGPALALALLMCVLFPVFIVSGFQQIIDFIVEFSVVTINK
jgi:prepilin signal peptidase PulO-like enzyme (type II secretory pathway)